MDDDQDDLFLIAEAFEKYTDHLRVVHAHNGQEGLKALDRMCKNGSLPCLVIIDINMPVMDGREMLRHIKAHAWYRSIPVVMFTTSSSFTDKDYATKLGADFITKPTTYKDMESLVAAFVNKCWLEAAARA